MGKSTKIRRLIQKIAIILAVILALPQMPMAQRMGLGYVEAHAAGTAPVDFQPNYEVLPNHTKVNLYPHVDKAINDGPAPEGTVAYEYRMGANSVWTSIESWDVAEAYEWTLPTGVYGNTVEVKMVYSGDDTYAGAEAIIKVDLEGSSIKISDATKSSNDYSFTLNLDKVGEALEYYYYLIVKYEDVATTTTDPLTLKNYIFGEYNNNPGANNTEFGFAEISRNITTVNIIANGSSFSDGTYVLFAVTGDEWGNLSNVVVSNPFSTATTYTSSDIEASVTTNQEFATTPLTPQVNFKAISTDAGRKAAASTWISNAVSAGSISFEFKQIKDIHGNDIANSPKKSTISAAGLFEIYALGSCNGYSISNEKIGFVSVSRIKTNPASVDIIYQQSAADKKVSVKGSVTEISGYGTPTGKLTYEYSEDGSTWNAFSENIDIDNEFTWTVPNAINNKKFSIRATYSGDFNYNSATSQVYTVDFEAPLIANLSPVTVNDSDYTFSLTLNNLEDNGGLKYYCLLTPYDNDDNYTTKIGDIIELPTQSGTFVGSSLSLSATIDGTNFEGGKYVFQIVLMDINGNISEKYITNPFDVIVQYDAPNAKPALNISVSDDKTSYIVTIDVTSVTNNTGRTIEYSFDGENYGITNAYEAFTGEEVMAYIRFAASEYYIASAPVNETITTSGASAAPILTESGSFSTTKTIEIIAANDNDTIYYTTDGSEPVLTSTTATGRKELIISANTTIKAFAVEEGKIKSAIASATYTYVEAPDNDPILNISVSNDKTKYIITVDTSTVTNKTGKTVEYSFDGESYGATSTYEATAGEEVTAYIRFAADGDTVASAPVSAKITTSGASVAPTVTTSDSFSITKTIEIKAANASDTIYYTIDGNEPSLTSETAKGRKKLTVSATTTVKAFAVEDGKIKSAVVSGNYTYVEAPDNAPVLNISVSNDKIKYIITVNASSVTNGANKTIEYSFDGESYGTTDTYAADAEESVTAYIRFAATDNTVASAPVSATTTTSSTSTAPTLTASGSFATATKTVEITGANDSAIIYYTTDGSEPTLTSTTATGRKELIVNATTTVKAFAVEEGKIKSAVVSATYTYVEAPDNAPALNISVSDDKTKYIVTVDTSSVTNKTGKTIEYSFDGENYGTKNTYEAAPKEEIIAYIRFAATDSTVASAPVSAETTTGSASAAPTLTATGSFAIEKTVEIKAANASDIIYYTTDGSEPALESTTATGRVEITVSATTAVKAFVVETDKVKSEVVSATYSNVEAPNNKPALNVSVSADKTKYIVTVDTSSVTNAAGKTIEYSFDGQNYADTNTFEAAAGVSVTAYIRFAATNDIVASAPVSETVTTNGASAAPTLTAPGYFSSATKVVEINAANPADVIYYTTDGTEPTLTSATAIGKKELTVSTTTTVKAFAIESGKIKSAVASATYSNVEAPNNKPALNVSVSADKTKYIVTVDTSSVTNAAGKTIEYSFDGQNYADTNTYKAAAGEIVTAYIRFAATGGTVASDPVSETVTTNGASTAPTLTASGSFSSVIKTVEINAANPTDVIYYTTDGTDPTLSSKTATGKKKLSINATTTVKAFTVEAGKIKSAVATSTYTYVEAPDHKPALNVSVSADKTKYIVTVDISSVTIAIGKTIEYSFDGQNYEATNTYEAAAGETVTAYIRFAATGGTVASAPVSETVTTNGVSATPTLTASGHFSSATKTIEIKANNSNYIIYYTTDGTEPTLSSETAIGKKELSISETTTVKAVAVIDGKLISSVAEAIYTKDEPSVYSSSDIMAEVNGTLTYTGEELNPVIVLSAISQESARKTLVNSWLTEQLEKKTITYSFKQVLDGDGKEVTADAKTTVMDAGTYEIIVSTTDESVLLSSSSYGRFIVNKKISDAPQGEVYLSFTPSDDGKGYYASVDTSALTNAEGKKLEYSFDEVNYINENNKLISQGSPLTVYVRFQASSNIQASEHVTVSNIYSASDIKATAQKIVYNGSAQSPLITLTAASDTEKEKQRVEVLLANVLQEGSIKYSYKYVADGNGRAITDSVLSDTVKYAGTYLIYAESTDPILYFSANSIGTLVVSKSSDAPTYNTSILKIDVSEDKKSYIVSVDNSAIINAEGKILEYCFDNGFYTTVNSYIVNADTNVKVNVRFMSSANSNITDPVVIETKTPSASKKPTIGIVINNNTRMVAITPESSDGVNADNSKIEVYYTFANDSSEFEVGNLNWGLGNIYFEARNGQVVKAVAVEPGRIMSDISTYTVSSTSNGTYTTYVSSATEDVTGLDVVDSNNKSISKVTLELLYPNKNTIDLKALVNPEDATNKNVRWEVDSNGVIELSSLRSISGSNISIRALKPGKVTITAYSLDSSMVYKKVEVNVKPYNIEANINAIDEVKYEIYNPDNIKLVVKLDKGENTKVTAKIIEPTATDPKYYLVVNTNNKDTDHVKDKIYVYIGNAEESYFEEKNALAKFELTIEYTNTITYHTNGSAPIASEKFTSFQKKILPTPTAKGYRFEGWYYDATFRNILKSEGNETNRKYCIPEGRVGDVDVYAKWIVETSKITFKPNYTGATVADKVQEFSNNSVVNLIKNSFKHQGYSFAGWATEADSVNIKYQDGQSVKFDKDQVLYAVWVKKTDIFEVTLDYDGGTISKEMQKIWGNEVFGKAQYTYGDKNGCPELPTAEKQNLTKPNYIFNGWKLANGKVVKSLDGLGGNITLIAEWIPATYTVTLNNNNGKLNTKVKASIKKQQVKYGSYWKPLENPFKVNGYRLAGWASTPDAKSPDVESDISEYTYSGDITLYAVWEAEVYTVSFYSEYGDIDIKNYSIGSSNITFENNLYTFTYTYDSYKESKKIVLPTNDQMKPTIKGLKLLGWHEIKEGSGEINKSKITTIKPYTNIKLVAEWIADNYTVVYHYDEETETESKTYAKKQKLKANGKVKEGYIFAGWALAEDGRVEFCDQEIVTGAILSERIGKIPDSLTYDLYAVFVPNADKYNLIILDSEGNPVCTTSYEAGEGVAKKDLTALAKNYSANFDYFVDLAGKKVTSIGKKVRGDQILKIVEKPVSVYVTYDPNIDSINRKRITDIKSKLKQVRKKVKSDAKKISYQKYKVDGYTLIGFSTDPYATDPEYYFTEDGKSLYVNALETHDGTNILEKLIDDKNVILYAVWEINNVDKSYIYVFDLGPDESVDDGMTIPDYEALYNCTKTTRIENGEVIVTLENVNQKDYAFSLPTPTRMGYYLYSWSEVNNKGKLVKFNTNKFTVEKGKSEYLEYRYFVANWKINK